MSSCSPQASRTAYEPLVRSFGTVYVKSVSQPQS